MDVLTSHVQLMLIIVLISSFVEGNIVVGKRYSENIGNRKTRVKRHVVLDNDKLCKAVGCVNGYCKESELRKYRIVCECFTGYKGKLCDRPKCPYDCGKHGTCSRKGPILYCKCDKGFFGAKCDSFAQTRAHIAPRLASKSLLKAFGGILLDSSSGYQPQNSLLSSRSSWFAHTASPKHFSEFHSHAEIDKSIKPDVCAPGFQCYHGHCDRIAMSYGLFQCLCKTNYTGLFCEKRCTLSCKNGGRCMVLDDGHQLCSCPFNFTGHFCEKAAEIG